MGELTLGWRQTAEADLSQFGIVKVNFELPMYVLSGLQVMSLPAPPRLARARNLCLPAPIAGEGLAVR